jgi:hypothetical protein
MNKKKSITIIIYSVKKLFLLLTLGCGLWAIFPSCKEVGPDIDLDDAANDTTLIDTTYIIASIPAAQSKIVALEEFTGVRCINCPDGHEQIKNIQTTYPGRVVAVSLHSEFLGAPYSNQPDFRIAEAQDLEELLGPAAAKPMASIDRVLFSGETSVLQFLQQWSGRVVQQLNAPVPVNIEIESRLDGNDIIAKITLMYLQSTTSDNRITLMLSEDSVKAAQLTNTSVDSNYIHNHLVRAFATRYNGNTLNYELNQGRIIVKEFRFAEISSTWNINNLKVICLIHEFDNSKKILQAAERKVLP